MQAYLCAKGERFNADNHSARDAAMKQAPEIRQVIPPYKALKSLSEQVLYDAGFHVSPADLAGARTHETQIVAILGPKLQRKLNPES